MKTSFLAYGLAIACTLAACGDDSSTSPNTNNTGDTQISSSSVAEAPSSSSNENKESKTESSSSVDQSRSSNQEISSSSVTAKGFPANYNQETGILTDERDGEVYKTAKVGNKIWMAQGLRYLPAEPAEGCEFKWVDETEDPDSLKTYGRHYSWLGATRIPCDYMSKTISFGNEDFPLPHQGVCPKGWHIPQQDEWKELAESVNSYISKLISQDWNLVGATGTDDYGFNVPHPERGKNHIEFIELENSGKKGYTMVFNDYGTMVRMETNLSLKDVENGYLRCLMDQQKALCRYEKKRA